MHSLAQISQATGTERTLILRISTSMPVRLLHGLKSRMIPPARTFASDGLGTSTPGLVRDFDGMTHIDIEYHVCKPERE